MLINVSSSYDWRPSYFPVARGGTPYDQLTQVFSNFVATITQRPAALEKRSFKPSLDYTDILSDLRQAIAQRDMAVVENILFEVHSDQTLINQTGKFVELVLLLSQNRIFNHVERLVRMIPTHRKPQFFRAFDALCKEKMLIGKFSSAIKIYADLLRFENFECTQRAFENLASIHNSFFNFTATEKILEKKSLSFITKSCITAQLWHYQAFAKQRTEPFESKELSRYLKDDSIFFRIEPLLSYNILMGHANKSYEIYEKALSDLITNSICKRKILKGMAKCQLMLNNLSEALNLFKKADELDPSREEYVLNALNSYEFMGEVGLVVRTFRRHLFEQKCEKEAKSLCTLFLKICYRERLFDEALALEEKILGKYPDLAVYYIKIHAAKGDDILPLIKKYQPRNEKVGPFFCEVARLYLNPCSQEFDLDKAEDMLKKSIEFTHQYGDAWIELIRLKLVKEGLDADLSELSKQFVGNAPNHGELWCYFGGTSITPPLMVFANAHQKLKKELALLMPVYESAKKGWIGTDNGEFFSASPSFCRSVRHKFFDHVCSYIRQDMIFFVVNKVHKGLSLGAKLSKGDEDCAEIT